MWRTLLFFLKAALLVALAVWLANHPGDVTIVWLGREIHLQVGILVALFLFAAVALAILWQVWRWFARSPAEIARSRREARRRKGYKALTQGMAAVAAGDAEEARRQASRASVLLNEPPLTLLLAAQAAQLDGDEQAAHKYFTAMLERPETRFLGLRGLLTQSLKANDVAAALDYASRAHRERPGAAWATTTLLDLQLRQGDWTNAEITLKEAAKQKAIDPDRARRMQGVILAEWARLGATDPALAGNSGTDPLTAAREAVKRAPELVPARVLLAQLLARSGNEKAAAKAIEQGWPTTPHPALAAAYAALRPEEDGVARLRRFEKLAALNPQHRESRLAVAEAALAAGLWGEARAQLTKVAEAEAEAPSARLARLMARLEEGERGDGALVRHWLMLASEGAEPAWICERCGTPTAQWQARCGHCEAFDSLAWRAAPRPSLALPLAPTGHLSRHPALSPVLAAAGTATGTAELELGGPTAPPLVPGPRDDGTEAEAEAGAGVDAARLVN